MAKPVGLVLFVLLVELVIHRTLRRRRGVRGFFFATPVKSAALFTVVNLTGQAPVKQNKMLGFTG